MTNPLRERVFTKSLALCKHPLRIWLYLILLTTGCGYHLGRGALVEEYATICVPYVEGDQYGYMTTALIRAVTERGSLRYDSGHPELILKVCLQEPVDETIGYIFAVEDDEPQDFLLSNEARLGLTAIVTLLDGRTNCPLFGPFPIAAWIDYDFDPDLTNVNDHALSLGQLEMHNEAQDAAFSPVFELLAQKIADYIYNSW